MGAWLVLAGTPFRPDPRLWVAGQLAVHENQAKRAVLGRIGGGDVAAVFAVDFATVKNGRCRAINKIHATLHVAIGEEIPAIVDEQRVLPAEKPAMIENLAVAVRAHRQRLAVVAGGILKRDVVRVKIIGEHNDTGVVVDRVSAAGRRLILVQRTGEDGGFQFSAGEFHMRLFLRDNELAVVSSRLDENGKCVCAIVRRSSDGVLKIREGAGAVGRNHCVKFCFACRGNRIFVSRLSAAGAALVRANKAIKKRNADFKRLKFTPLASEMNCDFVHSNLKFFQPELVFRCGYWCPNGSNLKCR